MRDFGGESTALIFKGRLFIDEEEARSYSSITFAKSSSEVIEIRVSKSPVGN